MKHICSLLNDLYIIITAQFLGLLPQYLYVEKNVRIILCFRFHAIKDHLVEFNQVAIEAAEGSHDMINRVMTKDNIGLALLLETTDSVWANGKWEHCLTVNAT